MVAKERSKLVEALAAVPDPRRQCKNLLHQLVDVLVIGFCGVLCGCEDFVEMEEFGTLLTHPDSHWALCFLQEVVAREVMPAP